LPRFKRQVGYGRAHRLIVAVEELQRGAGVGQKAAGKLLYYQPARRYRNSIQRLALLCAAGAYAL